MIGIRCPLTARASAACEACAAHARFMADIHAVGGDFSRFTPDFEPLLLEVLHAGRNATQWPAIYQAVQDALRSSTAEVGEPRSRLFLFVEENSDLAAARAGR